MNCHKRVTVCQNAVGKPVNLNGASPIVQTVLTPSTSGRRPNIRNSHSDDTPPHGGVWLGYEILYHQNCKK
jgi:hypothetical protein